MKKLFNSIFALSFMLIFFNVLANAQTEEVVFTDSVSNSQTKTVEIDLESGLDSVVVAIFSYGEIDVDSLDVKLGLSTFVKYKNYRQPLVYYAATNTTYSKTLTINLADGATSYLPKVTTVPKSAITGYNKLKIAVTAASSGNDTTDAKQKLVIIIYKYT